MTEPNASAVTAAPQRLLSAPAWYALAACALLAHAATVWQWVDHFPKFDDLNDAFGFFRQLAIANTHGEKILAFFYPNNEHITASNHLIYFLQFELFGSLDFRSLTLLGHGIIVTTALLLGLGLPQGQRAFAIAIMVLCYVNLHAWDSSFKAMTALSNQSVLLFAIASLYCLLQQHRFWLAVLLALAATFSQGNGLLVWFTALPALLLSEHKQPKHATLLWLGTATLAIIATALVKQHFATANPIASETLLSHWLARPWLPLQAIPVFLGSTAWAEPYSWLAGITGATALGFCLWQLPQWLRTQPASASILLFLLGSAVIAAVMRVLTANDLTGAMASRYRMYSLAFVPMVLLLFLQRCPTPSMKRCLTIFIAIFALAVHTSGYRHGDAVHDQTTRFRDSYNNWLVDGDLRRQAVYFPPMSDHFLFAAHHLQVMNLLSLSSTLLASLEPATGQQPCPTATPQPNLHCPLAISHRGNAIALAVTITSPEPTVPAAIPLCDGQKLLGSLVLQQEKPTENRWLLPEAQVPTGQYRALWRLQDGSHCEILLQKKPRKVASEMQKLFAD